jgi:DUF4097 and DUF4098 domain-containing protein YvlB
MRNGIPGLLGVLAVSALLTGCHGVTASERDTVEESRPLEAGGRFAVENTNGRIEVYTWDRNEVRIEAERAASSRRALEDIEIEIEAGDNEVRVKTRLPRFGFFGGSSHVNYNISVPRGVHLEVQSVNGRVRIEDASASLQASTVNGRVEIEGTPTDVEASTVNGSVEARYESIPAGGRHHYSATNGSLTLHLPAETQGHFLASTVNGGIGSDLPLEVEGKFHKRIDARLGEGGGDYELSTVNGSIKIREG